MGLPGTRTESIEDSAQEGNIMADKSWHFTPGTFGHGESAKFADKTTKTATSGTPGAWAPDAPLTYPVRFGDGRVVKAEDL